MAKCWTVQDCNKETLCKGDLVEAAPGIENRWWVSGMTLGVIVGIPSDGYCYVDIKETLSKSRDVFGRHMAPGRCLRKLSSGIEVKPSEQLLKLNMSFMY